MVRPIQNSGTDSARDSTDTSISKWDRFAGGTTLKRYQQLPPPPELSEHGKSVERTGGTWAEKYGKKIVAWDVAPGKEVFDEIFKKYTSKAELVRMKTMNMGSLYKLTYNVTIKSGVKEKDFLDEIRVKNCNLKVLLSHPRLEEEI